MTPVVISLRGNNFSSLHLPHVVIYITGSKLALPGRGMRLFSPAPYLAA